MSAFYAISVCALVVALGWAERAVRRGRQRRSRKQVLDSVNAYYNSLTQER